MEGKVTILKRKNYRSLILPQIQFLFSVVYIPDKLLKEIDSLLLNYLWGNKPANIKRSTITAPIKDGGLNMIDVFAVHTTAKCSWIKRLLIGEKNTKCTLQ